MATSKKGGASQKGKRMSQSEVLNHFAERFDLKRARVKEIFDELADLAAKEVKRNEEFVLPGFGKLVLAKRQAREGRNPQTGETIKIPAKTTLKFRLSKGMKDTAAPAKKRLPAPEGLKTRRGSLSAPPSHHDNDPLQSALELATSTTEIPDDHLSQVGDACLSACDGRVSGIQPSRRERLAAVPGLLENSC